MNTMTKPKSFMSLRKKLFSAAAMLLVASIMLVSTSYAWLVLSTAPEVTGVATQMGANGALEIVLLDTDSYNDVSMIAEFDVDESLGDQEPLATATNLQWGNLVNLGDSRTYGWDKIVLNPSRLAITPSGNDAEGNAIYTVLNTLLKTPVYSEDGRIIKLEQTAVSSVYDGDFYMNTTGQDYGVRAIGVVSDKSEAQQGIDDARTALTNYMADARAAVGDALMSKGSALANIAVKYVGDKNATFTSDDAKTLRELTEGLDVALDDLEAAIRQMYVAHVYTLGLTGDALANAKAYVEQTALETLRTEYNTHFNITDDAKKLVLPNARAEVGGDIIQLLVADQAAVAGAIEDCRDLEAKTGAITAGEIMGAMKTLVDHTKMKLNGTPIGDLNDINAIIGAVTGGGGLVLEVPTGSGIISDVADYADKYEAPVKVENFSYGSFQNVTITATMSAVTSVNPAYLESCRLAMRTFNIGEGAAERKVITDYYGYAVDLAFRINTENANLLLQTESAQRIYDESTNAATQGGGSFMEYEPKGGMSASKMIKLMSGVRVVFMDKTQKVLAIAALDTALEKDDYVLTVNYGVKTSVTVGGASVEISADNCTNYKATISDTEYEALGATTAAVEGEGETKYTLGKDAYSKKGEDADKYAVLKGVALPQNSDYISKTAYELLGNTTEKDDYTILPAAEQVDEKFAVLTSTMGEETPTYIDQPTYEAKNATGAVTIDPATGKIKAKLYLYDFEMPKSKVNVDEETGAIKLKNKLESAAITALEENIPKQVTALVYLDGSIVNNSMVAAEGGKSMTGVLNLQFASDVMLTPMNNQELFDGKEDAQEPETPVVNENGNTPAEGGDDEQTVTDPVTDPTTDPDAEDPAGT